jgi:TonB family protein
MVVCIYIICIYKEIAMLSPPSLRYRVARPEEVAGMTGLQMMQALIAADGVVEDLRVLSGPTILVSAAREAVRQWRFKPYLQNGKPVETQARVTVNFTIKVTNNTARYQSTSITSDGAL